MRNRWNFLKGTNPTEGGNAAFYDIEDETKLLREYDLLLAEALDLTNIKPIATKKQPSSFTDSTEINAKLDLIMAKLGIKA